MIKSPFLVREDFISPLQCEELISRLAEPTTIPIHAPVPAGLSGNILSELDALTPLIERQYNAQLFAEPVLTFNQYPENPAVPAEAHKAEGWKYLRKKWVKSHDVDLVGFIWLKTYHAAVPLDPRFEVYGAKLEFPAYNFSLTPIRGTLVLFPATPHFVHAISHVMLGNEEHIKINLKLRVNGLPWTYHPESFPGSYQQWFIE